MSTILAIETSTEVASAALIQQDSIYSEISEGVHSHSEKILPMVQSLLKQAGISLSQCDAIAFGKGPGSFTGVRTACGVVQGLAFGADIPVIPVITLQAMAQASLQKQADAIDVVCVMDARMGEVYWAQYHFNQGQWQEVIQPTLSLATEIQPQGNVWICGNGVAIYASAFEDQAWVKGIVEDVMPHAIQTAQLANMALSLGHVLPAEEAQPLYLRNKVALTIAEREERDRAKAQVG